MSDLKPCPFCGQSDANIILLKNGGFTAFQHVCNYCGSRGPESDTQEKAESSWNRRANPAPADSESVEGVVDSWSGLMVIDAVPKLGSVGAFASHGSTETTKGTKQ